MKRWIAAATPGLIVIGVNLLAVFVDGYRHSWRLLLLPSVPAGYAIHAATALGVVLLTLAALRGVRAWHVMVPAMPPITAAVFAVRALAAATATTVERHDHGFFWPDLVRVEAVDSATFRVLASIEGAALALALALIASRSRPSRASLAMVPLAAAAFAIAGVALYGPLASLDARTASTSGLTLALLVASIVAPVAFAASFERAPRDDESSPSTPYREPPERGVATATFDARSASVMAAALLPWIARGLTRGMVHLASFPFVDGAEYSLTAPLDETRREGWLSLAWRWDRAIIPLSLLLVALSLARGVDRRALRVWALAALCVFGGDLARTQAFQRLRTSMVARRSPFVSVSTPGTSWLERAGHFSPEPSQIWRANGTVETLRSDAHRDEWHVGPLVFGDAPMRASVWSAHLRRWRATSRDGVLTLAGQCSPTQPRWHSDPRQEVDLSNVYNLDGCHAIFEVASPADRANALILMVMSATTARLDDGLEVDVRTFQSQVMTIVVVPGGESVTASEVVSAAKALSGRGRRVMLGD